MTIRAYVLDDMRFLAHMPFFVYRVDFSPQKWEICYNIKKVCCLLEKEGAKAIWNGSCFEAEIRVEAVREVALKCSWIAVWQNGDYVLKEGF